MYFELIMPGCNGKLIVDQGDVISYVQDAMEFIDPGEVIKITATTYTEDQFKKLPEHQGC